jgi:hypothetical protein
MWIPGGWEVRGAFPPFDPSTKLILGEGDMDWLTEDIWQARSPGERLILDLGWYPHEDPTGGFRAVMVLNREWMKPLDLIDTPSLETARTWIGEKIRPFL